MPVIIAHKTNVDSRKWDFVHPWPLTVMNAALLEERVINPVEVEVEVTLWPRVSRPVRLGVLPLLEQVTRCYIYLSDNYFHYFSCRAPSLTRGRIYNLQCNDASSISSYIATESLSASSSWCRDPNGKKSPLFMMPEMSLPFSQGSAIEP
jgi:hypothetical protein